MDDIHKKAESAKEYWLGHSLDEYDYVLLLPHNDGRLNEVMLSAFEEKLRKAADANNGAGSRAVVLSVGSPGESEYYMSIQISEELAESLITLYCMYEFTDRLIIGSFYTPYGRKLKNLLDCGIASENELAGVIFS